MESLEKENLWKNFRKISGAVFKKGKSAGNPIEISDRSLKNIHKVSLEKFVLELFE